MNEKISRDNKYYIGCEYDKETKLINKIIIIKVPEDVKDVEEKTLKEYMKNYINNIYK